MWNHSRSHMVSHIPTLALQFIYSQVVTQRRLITRSNQGGCTSIVCVLSWQTCLAIGQSSIFSHEQKYHTLVQTGCCQLRERLWGVQLIWSGQLWKIGTEEYSIEYRLMKSITCTSWFSEQTTLTAHQYERKSSMNWKQSFPVAVYQSRVIQLLRCYTSQKFRSEKKG
jgi:hypothetical protein